MFDPLPEYFDCKPVRKQKAILAIAFRRTLFDNHLTPFGKAVTVTVPVAIVRGVFIQTG